MGKGIWMAGRRADKTNLQCVVSIFMRERNLGMKLLATGCMRHQCTAVWEYTNLLLVDINTSLSCDSIEWYAVFC